MKKYLLLAAVMMLPCFSKAVLESLQNSGPLSVKWMVSNAGPSETILDKTNTTATSTNISLVFKTPVTNSIFHTADLMALLENSFDTTFPTNSQLVLEEVGNSVAIFLADASGTNIVKDLSTNLTLSVPLGADPVISSLEAVMIRTNRMGVSYSNTEDESFTITEVLNYDDTGLTTKDGTHSQFQVTCLVVAKSSQNFVAGTLKDKVTLQGIGFGTIRNRGVEMQGTGTATITGVLLAP